MAEMKWTLQASSDLEDITSFIAQDSEYYASFRLGARHRQSSLRIGELLKPQSAQPNE